MKRQKFSQAELYAKNKLKKLREEAQMGMKEAAQGMGLKVKNLEDIETVQPYGRHISIDIMIVASKFYGICITELVEK